MADLLTIDELPDGFNYPPEFIRVVELGLTSLEPWWIINVDLLRSLNRALATAYPERHLALFAKRENRDDVACWDLAAGDVAVVHVGASPGCEQRGARFPNFNAWLRQAIEDLIEHGG
ncbi:hypothetical protein [Streptomyces morookaense]|uniref:Knr4/Smi1-like domain-containing protein n=1 Tax=Streptomyces morookaense TaxID=1970 RepID=A0A7Y7B8Z1_STRMO|nr:hypothetical protein [Streptomyces morookaense]NVK81218.1 hypothetical protein [Streptomyces morookaense]GHF30462.1 hypothetical protein GCM10010359_35710 [Streptomyces morookaense]